ncbi:MAG: hypothetical protein F4206_09880 [Gammaproteobacteria bacterium]|nr:hypothetical protein [Gammaproteobacteria bacterium]MYG67013.1 hypothetical protein [Gammaproteobacteria bacterium]
MISTGKIATYEARKRFEKPGTDIVTIEMGNIRPESGIAPDDALAMAGIPDDRGTEIGIDRRFYRMVGVPESLEEGLPPAIPAAFCMQPWRMWKTNGYRSVEERTGTGLFGLCGLLRGIPSGPPA